jgi:pyridoxamine 5'-phosphate oxidase
MTTTHTDPSTSGDERPDHDLGALRQDYKRGALDEGSVSADPVEQFATWFEEARSSDLPEPNAMIVATVSAEGQPTARTVLLKGFGPDGFRFFSNYDSQKGRDLAGNPRVGLLFYWGELERQVRIDGDAHRLDRQASADYFHTRPRGSQISAAASPQSEPLPGREALDRLFTEAEDRFGEDDEVPLPDFWGGYVVVPRRFEFWQGRRSRRHDRVTYERDAEGAWRIGRLAP